METNSAEILSSLENIQTVLETSFWSHGDFWITAVLTILGVFLSGAAFFEARRAKKAATDAGKTVKIQTVTIELSELQLRLDKLNNNIQYDEARNMLAELSRRIRRLVFPFRDDTNAGEAITNLCTALDTAKKSLSDVRPKDGDTGAPVNAVYNAIETDLSTVADLVAEVMGLLESQSYN